MEGEASSMNQPFLITGCGRSGTEFLSRLMDKSPTWTVEHEPRGKHTRDQQEISVREYREVFVPCYGEVNCSMRGMLGKLDWVREGVILRDPYDIALSLINRRPEDVWDDIVLDLVESYLILDKYLSHHSGIRIINFRRMTTEVEYARRLMTRFGIDDVAVDTSIIRTKVNRNREYAYHSLPWRVIDMVQPVEFMIKKWGI